jgi:hypothetical protein
MKWILIKSNNLVENVVVPGDGAYRTALQNDGYSIFEEDDDIPVAQGYTRIEEGVYSDPALVLL